MSKPEQLCSPDGAADRVRRWQLIGVRPYLLQSRSRGHIRLVSRDPLAKPLVYENMLDDPDDVERLLEPIRICERLFMNTDVFAPYNVTLIEAEADSPCRRHATGSDDYWRCVIRYETDSVSHQVGTCKMGARDDREAVVDERLRVIGVRGLRVIDGSVMPTLASANTNAATMMIGEKGAAAVVEDWKRRELAEVADWRWST